MNTNIEYEPSPDFVSKTMRRIYAFEASRNIFLKRIVTYTIQRYVLALGGAVFGILHATRVF